MAISPCVAETVAPALLKRQNIGMSTLAADEPSIAFDSEGKSQSLRLSGDWTVFHARRLDRSVGALWPKVDPARALVIDAGGLTKLDTFGALAIAKLQSLAGCQRTHVTRVGFSPDQNALIEQIAYTPPTAGRPSRDGAFDILADIGEGVVSAWRDLVNGIDFLGRLIIAIGRALVGLGRFRPAALVTQLERIGLRGVPIIVLISFLVGAIIAQQSIFQLRTFGTVQFVADLLGILVLRELAVLLTSIMIAGRSGSSFTAELGSMKMREEIDALRTMGRDPIEVLVVPRVIALIVALPLLTFVSAMSGLLGGGMVAFYYGGVSPEVFMARLQNAIGLNTFLVGMIKAPFMALVIGLIACIEGMNVRGSAESLGQHTTASVVKAIFMVIVVDGLFAMFFAAIRY